MSAQSFPELLLISKHFGCVPLLSEGVHILCKNQTVVIAQFTKTKRPYRLVNSFFSPTFYLCDLNENLCLVSRCLQKNLDLLNSLENSY